MSSSSARALIFASDSGTVEDLRVAGPRARAPRAESFSPEFQISLPYHGLCIWHVGRDDVMAEPGCVKFIRGDEGYRVSRPLDDGHGEVIVTIPRPVLAELLNVDEARLGGHALFRQRSRAADPRLQYLGARWRQQRVWPDRNCLSAEESLLFLVRHALRLPATEAAVTPATTRLVNRAKEYLAAHAGDAALRLSHVAMATGVTPSYLSTLFRRAEGLPLHRYAIRLRLARALAALPDVHDLSRLALDVGFSHHSHFTEAFRRRYGVTPSACRAALRR